MGMMNPMMMGGYVSRPHVPVIKASSPQGMMGGGLGSGAYGVSWLPPWMQALTTKSPWYW